MIHKTGFPLAELRQLIKSSDELVEEAERVNAAQGLSLSSEMARAEAIRCALQVIVRWAEGADL